MEITHQALRSAFTAFNASFKAGLGQATPQWDTVATRVPSSTASNEYGWLGSFPGMRKWVGDRVINNLAKHGYSLTNEDYELTVAVHRNSFRDDTLGIYSPMFEEIGRAARALPDELVFGLLKRGFEEPCYDGQYYFDADHPVRDKDGNTQSVSNFGGGTGTPWYLMDTSRSLKPLIFQEREPLDKLVRLDDDKDLPVFMRKEHIYGTDGRCQVGFGFWQIAFGSKQPLDPASYEAARVALMEMTGDHGRPLGIVPRTLVVPPSLEGAANKIVKNGLTTGGETNQWAGTAEVVVVPWLAT